MNYNKNKYLLHLNDLKKRANILFVDFGLRNVDKIKESLGEDLSYDDWDVVLEDAYKELGIKMDENNNLDGLYSINQKYNKNYEIGDIIKIDKNIDLISMQDLIGQDLEIVGTTVGSGLIGEPHFLILKDNEGNIHEVNPNFIDEVFGDFKKDEKTLNESLKNDFFNKLI